MRAATVVQLHGLFCVLLQLLVVAAIINFKFYCKFFSKFYCSCDHPLSVSVAANNSDAVYC